MASVLASHAVPSRPITSELGVYVHIPFCHAKCNFCDFATAIGAEKFIDKYLTALANESRVRGGGRLKTLFVGGGTPTTLSVEQINFLFSALKSNFDFSYLTEATVEANPESAVPEILSAFQFQGINRVSFGLQTTQDALLKGLNRLHTFEDFLRAYRTARALGFENINVDLMYGLPGQTMAQWEETLKLVSDLNPEHISAYALKVEAGTRFKRDGLEPDDDLEADMYLRASDFLVQRGYRHYEISNFSRPGFESTHNIRYWENDSTLGLGLSAASYENGVRSKNPPQLNSYLDSWLTGSGAQKEEILLTSEQSEKETLMLRLRLDNGIGLADVKKYGTPNFEKFVTLGLAVVDQGRYRLTPRGWLLSNQLFQDLVLPA